MRAGGRAEPGGVHPSMAKADVWPLSSVETVLLAVLAYLVLLIGLAGARAGGRGAGAPAFRDASVLAIAGATRPVSAEQRVAVATCVSPRTVPAVYAASPGAVEPLAFGPPVEPSGPRRVAEINGTLIQRLCGGVPAPGRPRSAPDRRLFVALDAVVNGRDPNRVVSREEWAAGVDRLITRDARWEQARVVTRTVPRGTGTYGMRVRPGADPLVVRTRLKAPTASRYLVLPVRGATGRVVTLTLRLLCGFQPVF